MANILHIETHKFNMRQKMMKNAAMSNYAPSTFIGSQVQNPYGNYATQQGTPPASTAEIAKPPVPAMTPSGESPGPPGSTDMATPGRQPNMFQTQQDLA
jgi:hypothetical protein